jgi:hypothetical protein
MMSRGAAAEEAEPAVRRTADAWLHGGHALFPLFGEGVVSGMARMAVRQTSLLNAAG